MKQKILFIGALPPPYMGPTLANEMILESSLSDCFELLHLDTSDHRDIGKLNAIDFRNIYLALKHYFLLIYMILSFRPSVVYIPTNQNTLGFFMDSGYIILSKILQRRVVCHLRGGNFKNWYRSVNRPFRYLVRCLYRFVDAQIVLGDNLRHIFDGIVPAERIFVVPNGRDYPELERTRTGSVTGVRTVLYISNFIKSKGVLDVLHAIPFLVPRIKNTRFVLSGSWMSDFERKDMFDLIERHPEWPVTVIEGIKGAEKFRLLRSADIFVLPTYYPNEGHPWAIVEALAAGLPVVSTDHAAITESVRDGENGYLVEKKNPGDIAEKVGWLLTDERCRLRMGRASRKVYEENYTEEIMVNKFCSIFNQVLERY